MSIAHAHKQTDVDLTISGDTGLSRQCTIFVFNLASKNYSSEDSMKSISQQTTNQEIFKLRQKKLKLSVPVLSTRPPQSDSTPTGSTG